MRDERPGITPDGRYWLSKRPGSDRWQRTWFDTGTRQTRRESLGTSDFRAAHEALTVWWTENRRIEKSPPENVTLATILQRYYKHYAIEKIRSAEQARIACGLINDHSGDVPVALFRGRQQRALIEYLRERGYSAGYVRRTIGVAKSALSWAWREEMITHAPDVELPPDGAARDRVLSADEVMALWMATEREHERMFLALAFCTMGRPEAILEVTKEMADLERGLLALNPPGRLQTKKYRPTVPIVDELRPWIENAPSGRLVRWRGEPIESFKTAWRAIRRRARLSDDVVAKTIRHTMATELRTQGVPEADIQGFLGHQAYRGRTEVYAKYRPEYLGRAAAVVNDYMAALRCNCVAAAERVDSQAID